MLIGAMMNRAAGVLRRHLENLFLFICSMITVMFMTLVLELTERVQLHNPAAYRAVALFVPACIAIAVRSTGRRWAATIMTGFYTAFMLGLLWILPLAAIIPLNAPPRVR